MDGQWLCFRNARFRQPRTFARLVLRVSLLISEGWRTATPDNELYLYGIGRAGAFGRHRTSRKHTRLGALGDDLSSLPAGSVDGREK